MIPTIRPDPSRHVIAPVLQELPKSGPAVQIPRVNQTTVDIRDLKMERVSKHDVRLSVEGQSFRVGDRFNHSLLGVIGQSQSVFNLFQPDEVLNRFASKVAEDKSEIRFSFEADTKPGFDAPLALAVSNTNKTVIGTGDLNLICDQMISSGQLQRAFYDNGVVAMECSPLVPPQGFQLGKSAMSYRYNAEVPVDGYGNPAMLLALLREICTNGAVGMGKLFSQPVNLSGDAQFSLMRALSTFNNMDGWEKLRIRMELAHEVPASLAEYEKTWRAIQRAVIDQYRAFGDDNKPLLTPEGRGMMWGIYSNFQDLGGEILAKFGIASLNQVDEATKVSTPVPLSVSDLINMLSEVSTHYSSNITAQRTLQTQVGTLLDPKYKWNLESVAKSIDASLFPGARDQERYFPKVSNRRENLYDIVGKVEAFGAAKNTDAGFARPMMSDEEFEAEEAVLVA